jgi:hypothetical protein
VGTLCVMHRCVKKHQNVKIRDPPVPHFSYVKIRDPPVPNNIIEKNICQRIVCSWLDVRPSRTVQSSICIKIFKSENRQFFFVLVFPIQTRNQRIPGSDYKIMSPRNLLGSVTLSLITGPTLGCGDCQSSNSNTFHLETSIEFGDLIIPGPIDLTVGPISENHPRPVGVQTNGATCQVVTGLAKVTKIVQLRNRLSES